MTTSEAAQRLYISGLHPTQCSPEDLQARFKSFDLRITDVHNWPPAENAVGQTSSWCFATAHGDEQKIRKVIGLLNGTMWRGSKLRVAKAKPQKWGDETVDAKAPANGISKDKEGDAEQDSKKKKRRKGVQGFEGHEISTPVSGKDIEDGLWGWKKTPAGHLVRPMHMRPEKPLMRPEHDHRDAGETSTGRKITSGSSRPVTRAKRTTIDPLRYQPVHLTGAFIGGSGSNADDTELHWSCEPAVDGKGVIWTARDAQGNIRKEERVASRQKLATPPSNTSSDDDSTSSASDILDEIDAAIDQASELSSSEDERVAEEKIKGSTVKHSDSLTRNNHSASFAYPSYDPEEDASFSDGYQEAAGEAEPKAGLDWNWTGEKSGQLSLLEDMFGSTARQDDNTSSNERAVSMNDDGQESAHHSAATEAREQIVSAAAARRAALLAPLLAKKQSHTFQPLQRFDPTAGTQKDAEPMLQEAEVIETEAPQSKNDKISQAEDTTIRPSDRIEMTSLTDMFRPKADKGSFSLMDNLELDLDDDFAAESDAESRTVGAENAYDEKDDRAQFYSSSRIMGASAPPQASSRAVVPLLFPQLDANGNLDIAHGKDIFSTLTRQQLGMDERNGGNGEMCTFLRGDDDATRDRKWEERKATLTQYYKRRHREALKKKKRGYVGSRAADRERNRI